jgi:hypothetical protein
MPGTDIVLHRGARPATRDQIAAVPVPEPTDTWFPVGHGVVLDTVVETLEASQYRVERTQLALARDERQFFGTLDLRSEIGNGATLAVGVRNSINKSLPIGFCAGSRVFVCDNLSFQSELLVSRKHTRFGGERFREAIAHAVGKLAQFREAEAGRITVFMNTEIDDVHAESLILRAYEQKVISHLQLPDVLKEWRQPQHTEFEPRTAWSLFNAFTEALKPIGRSSPQMFSDRTIRLHGLLLPAPSTN